MYWVVPCGTDDRAPRDYLSARAAVIGSLETEYRALDSPRDKGRETQCDVQTGRAALCPPMLSCVFFRPEEYGLSSKSIDDVRGTELGEIDKRQEDQGTALVFVDAALEISTDVDIDLTSAVGALCPYGYREILLS